MRLWSSLDAWSVNLLNRAELLGRSRIQTERTIFWSDFQRRDLPPQVVELFKSIIILGKWPKNRLSGQVIAAN
jgi:hypothetical protein